MIDKNIIGKDLCKAYAINPIDPCGGKGRAMECFVSAVILGVWKHASPLGKSDLHIRRENLRALNLESKSGCPWLIHGEAGRDKEDALELMATIKRLPKADYIAYVEEFDPNNLEAMLEEIRVFDGRTFLAIWRRHGKLKVKPDSANNGGAWGIGIQSWQEKYKCSHAKAEAIRAELAEYGTPLIEWAEHHGLNGLNIHL